SEARRLLDEHRPQAGEDDLRGFEWYLLSRIADRPPQAWRRHNGECYFARFSPDGTLLATSGQDGVRVWSWPAGDPIGPLTAHTADVNCVVFSPDGALLATGSDDCTARIFDTKSWTEIRSLPVSGDPVYAIVFSPDGAQLLLGRRHHAAAGATQQL